MNISLNTFAPRLLAGFGTAALVTAVGLFASSRPAHTAGGPIPVTVANVPLPTTPADLAAPSQPFQATTQYALPEGSSQGSLDSGDGFSDITVPTGKRLVIQAVSITCYVISGSLTGSAQAYINPTSGGNTQAYALPSLPANGTAFPGATQSVTLYADPGSVVPFTVYRSDVSSQEYAQITVSGYLVNK